MASKLPPKVMCEVCGIKDQSALNRHHLVQQQQIGTSNDWDNLIVLCANCHNFVHAGKIKILGVLPSTSSTGRTVVTEINGFRNIDIEVPIRHKVKGTRI